MRFLIIVFFLVVCTQFVNSQSLKDKQKTFTLQDTLRGTLNENRQNYDVLKYQITVKPNFNEKTLQGSVIMIFKANQDLNTLQVDLQQPMQLTSVNCTDNQIHFKRLYNTYTLQFKKTLVKNAVYAITMNFDGKPKEAIRPPWDGGWIWSKDSLGKTWASVACQGLGASVWFPCKDHQSDEPDSGAVISVDVPDDLIAIANGKNIQIKKTTAQTKMYSWEVNNPINTYNIVPYIGNYVEIVDSYEGENGTLRLNYWVLNYHKNQALEHFQQVKKMLKAFEYWFGPYPFYNDGFKLVESPHLGMEHQSAIAYGNQFKNGYLGRDLSGTGWGLLWDYIIIHESGHEWFGNNITTADIADMWIHEGFTMYSEVLFIEYYYGKTAGQEYAFGLRPTIQNDIPIIGPYGVNEEGSNDMYTKGANIINTIRNSLNNDDKFRQILKTMNQTYFHKIVSSQQIEDFIQNQTQLDLKGFFNQFLHTTKVPLLHLNYNTENQTLTLKFDNVVDDFKMQIWLDSSKSLIVSNLPTTILLPDFSKIDLLKLKSDLEFKYYLKVNSY